MHAVRVATSFVLLAILCYSQPAPRAFEVASVRVHPPPVSIVNLTTSGPRFKADAQYLGGLIMYAYNLKRHQLAFAEPNSALYETYFDVDAKAEGDTAPTPDEFRQMLRSLLADRFKLKTHHEMREIPVYALVVGKSGPKFKESAADEVVFGRHTMNGHNQVMTLTKATMEYVTQSLSVYADRPIVDKTGLSGMYDIKLEATPNSRINQTPDPADISVFVAVQKQLGLKLEPQKAMVEVVVVDHAEKPSEN